MIQMETRKKVKLLNFDEQQDKAKQSKQSKSKSNFMFASRLNLLANKQNVYTAWVDLVKEWERS